LFRVNFYRDKKGREPVAEYISDLAEKNTKDSRIKLNKIRDYIKILCEYGTNIGEPYIKHIEEDLWELRPLRNRILFVAWKNNTYVLLHVFYKKTQKTPQKEIAIAKKRLIDLKERRNIK